MAGPGFRSDSLAPASGLYAPLCVTSLLKQSTVPQGHGVGMLTESGEFQSGHSGERSDLDTVPWGGVGIDGIAQPVGLLFASTWNRKCCSLNIWGYVGRRKGN